MIVVLVVDVAQIVSGHFQSSRPKSIEEDECVSEIQFVKVI